MRYLRMLSNSAVAGVLATCYVLLVVLQLNPRLPLDAGSLEPLARTVGPYYALHLTAICYGALVVVQLASRELFSPAWISVGVLAWLGAIVSAAGSALMWANLRTFSLVLPAETIQAITAGAEALMLAAVLFVSVAEARRRSDRRLRPLWAAVLVALGVGSVAGPLALRGAGIPAPALLSAVAEPADDTSAVVRDARVRIIAIDGGSLEFVTDLVAEGRLPNFGRILDAGGAMHMTTLHPASAEAIWTAVATGTLPQRNGVRSAGIYRQAFGDEPIRLLPDFCFASGLVRFGFLAEEPHTSDSLRSRTLWGILSELGVSVGVVNWPLTYPATPVRGYLVTDRYARLALTPAGLTDPQLLSRRDLEPLTFPILRESAESPAILLLPDLVGLPERHRAPARLDVTHDRLARRLTQEIPTQVTVVRYESLDPIGHYFLRYAIPVRFGNVTERERQQFGSVLESHYAIIDEAIGRAIADIGPEDLLLVVSGYGMEPLSFGKRMLEQLIGDPEISGTHEAAPDGFLIAYGGAVEPARHVARMSVVDVLPTVLYFLGLPIGRDLDGYVSTALFATAFTDEHPITFIPSYGR